jgi:CheY-like chemotaxis protein
LVVDDESEIREIIRESLERHHAIVTEAGSAEEGFRVLEKNKIDVITSDLSMPGLDGLLFTRAAKERCGQVHSTVVCTGRNVGDAGFEHVHGKLVKPFSGAGLVKCVVQSLIKHKKSLVISRV